MSGSEVLDALSAELAETTNRELQTLAKAPRDQYTAQKQIVQALSCFAGAVVRAKHRLEKADAVKASGG